MSEIWGIIGLSSLIASVVTVILGIIRDVLIERYRFKRQSESGFIQKQLEVYYKFYYVLQRAKTTPESSILFSKDVGNELNEFNNSLKDFSNLVDKNLLINWLEFIGLTSEITKKIKEIKESQELEKKYFTEFAEKIYFIETEIIKIVNNKLIPKYKKIVGDTVPSL